MASLAESVIGGAQTQVQNGGQSVGNAVQAYQIAAQTENARQQLNVQKDENERNKGNWLASQVANIAKLDGSPEAQKLMVTNLKKQLPTLAPGVDPDAIDLLYKDKNVRQQLGFTAADAIQNGRITPDSFGAMTAILGDPVAAIGHAQKIQDNRAAVAAAQMKGNGMMERAQNMQDNTVLSAVNKIHDNPTVKQGVARGQSFDMDLDQLSKNPTWQTYNETFQNYANSLAGAKGVVSDAKLHEMQTALSGPSIGKWSTYASNHPDAAGNIADPEAVNWLKNKIMEINKINDIQMGTAARRMAANAAGFLHNKSVTPALQQTAEQYQNGGWRNVNPNYSGSPQAPAAPAVADFAHMTDAEVAAAYAKHKAGGQ